MTAATAAPVGTVPVARVPWQVKFVLLSVIWGSSFLLMKVGLGSLEAVQISWYRVLTGGAVLLALLLATGRGLPRSRRVWGHLSVAGFLLATLPFTLFAAAEERISSALAGIGNATTPMASVLFGLLLLPAARLPWTKVLAVALGLVGVVVVMQPWALDGRPDLLTADASGQLRFFANYRAQTGLFSDRSDVLYNPLSGQYETTRLGLDLYSHLGLATADLNADGAPELFVGTQAGGLLTYGTRNRTVTATQPEAARALARLAEAGIVVDDFSLGQPSLDEVFLALTDRPASDRLEEPVA